MKALTTLLVVGMFLMSTVLADDAEDVQAAFLGHFTTLRAHDSQSMAQNYMPDYTEFSGGGWAAYQDCYS